MSDEKTDIPMRELDGDHGWITHQSEVGTNNYITANVVGRERLQGVPPTKWTLHVGIFDGWFYGSEWQFSTLDRALDAAANFREFIEPVERHQHRWAWSRARSTAFWLAENGEEDDE